MYENFYCPIFHNNAVNDLNEQKSWSLPKLDVANLLSRYDSADSYFLRCYTVTIVACQNENEQALRRS